MPIRRRLAAKVRVLALRWHSWQRVLARLGVGCTTSISQPMEQAGQSAGAEPFGVTRGTQIGKRRKSPASSWLHAVEDY